MSRSMLRATVLALPLLVIPQGLLGQEVEERFLVDSADVEAARNAPLFQSHDVLELTLEADFSTIRKEDRGDDAEERPARITFAGPDGSPMTVDLQVRTRGIFRLERRNCENPPLRLNFRTSAMEGTVFEGQDKVKLVLNCRNRQSYYEQYVLQEYLLYRTYNLLTDVSFRVRLARVTYIDTSEDIDTFTRYAFLIEDEDALAVRNGGRNIEWPEDVDLLVGRVPPSPPYQLMPFFLEPHHAVLMDVFQYMIGNTDWSSVEFHNAKLIEKPDGTLFGVPYDFDFSGAVNARYANPDESLEIRNVKQRLFRGFCPEDVHRGPEVYDTVFTLFLEKKEEIYDLYRNQVGLEEGKLEDSLEYYDDFYEIVERPDRIESRIMRNCRRLRGE